MTRRRRDLFTEVMTFAEKAAAKPGGDLFVYAHTVNGKTVISPSKTNPFPKGYSEAKRVAGSTPRAPMTAGQIAAMHKMAAHVRDSYGEAAVGDLPHAMSEAAD